MQITFEAINENSAGIKWQNVFKRSWPAYKRWYLSEGIEKRPTYRTCLNKLKNHMPEIVPAYEKLCELAGGSDLAARFLSLYNPPAYISGCSQIIWPPNNPRLIRNYDYSPKLLDGMVLKSKWLDHQVIAFSDCLLGVLDGINEHGLCASLTFGGSRKVGDGFGIPIILRYILETCESAKQARQALIRIPTHMAYNVSVVDKNGEFFTAHLFPGKQTQVDLHKRIATNHQPFDQQWESYARASATIEREKTLETMLKDEPVSLNQLLNAFSLSPLYSTNYTTGFGTLYTSIYYPAEKVAEIRWPDSNWFLGFQHFAEGQRVIQYHPTGAMTLQAI